ncbi:dUTP diphosphatase [Methylosinus sp. RM1]|uniref:dUTP diphosphatase n=1 Tax=Methylosinus sp. RM1 TaxID=2583817 RepID=UPI00140C930D|nr:dUTP diphosphatase [Methylosinus sp. RM1]
MNTVTKIVVRRLPHGEGLPLPAHASEGAAGLDLCAALAPGGKLVLEPGARDLVPTGLTIALPPGFEAQVRPRSGLALEFGVGVLNAPGTVDCDYRGEVKVLLVNFGAHPFEISRGMRIAQLVVARYERVELVESAEALAETARGEAGFGSTGTDAVGGGAE